MASILIWLTNSKVGRWVVAVVAATTTVLVLLWRVFAAGKAAQVAKHDKETLHNIETRLEVEDEISLQTPDARRANLREWVSDNE